ncbi:MAG: methyltransferase domain-containing protein [Acidobacteria bacterium]|nr:methyltransferase domain-containing protein [Acidobacteriota bacterium]MBV9475252.1 methyltransferase domain-containing protein [Acidobacteriota bacterium]
MSWSPEQYERFKGERKQPFVDLAALVERRPHMHVVDLGCGTGELTRELHESLGADETVGIDNSETMLLKARAFGDELLRFERGDIEAFVSDRPFDLIFSNAALHWVPDHEQLLARLTSLLAPGGQLAIQMPDNDEHTSHRVAADVAARFGAAPRPNYVLPPARYAELLHRLGFQRQHVRVQIYGHLLPASSDVVEWVRGALLTHYEAELGARFDDFLATYREELQRALGEQRPYFYTYKRVLFWGSF